MIKIACDLDNVILDSPKTIINLYNELYENKLEYNDDVELGWKFEPLIKTKTYLGASPSASIYST